MIFWNTILVSWMHSIYFGTIKCIYIIPKIGDRNILLNIMILNIYNNIYNHDI